jgi:hypothetical protein
MYQIVICRSVGVKRSVVLAETIEILHFEEVPDDLDNIVEELGGDFCEINIIDDEEIEEDEF